MKKIFFIILFAFMITNASFSELSPGEELKELGVISGDENGNLNENKALKRSEMAVIFSQLYGLKNFAELYEIASSFSDVDSDAWYSPYVSYAEAQGWMSGDGYGSTFRPNDYMSAQEINAALLKVLGYDVKWDLVNYKAKIIGIDVNTSGQSYVLRGEMFVALKATLDATPIGKDNTLGYLLDLDGYIFGFNSHELIVESIVPSGNKTIEFKVNRPVRADENLVIIIKRSGESQDFTTSWSDDKSVITVHLKNSLVDANYDISLEIDKIEIYNESRAISRQKISRVEIVSKMINVSMLDDRGYFEYKVYDQYNNDITRSDIASDMSFYTSVGIASGKDGFVTIVSPEDDLLEELIVEVAISATIFDVNVNTTLTTTGMFGTLSTFDFGNTENVELNEGDIYHLPYTAINLSGENTKDYEEIINGLILNSEGNIIVSLPDYVSVKIVEDKDNPTNALIEVEVIDNPYKFNDITVTISVVLYNGKTSIANVTLLKSEADDD